jgi:hypothetical protein
MLASITPLGERSRRQRFWITVTFLVLGAALAGAAAGTMVAVPGRALPLGGNARLAALAGVLALGVLVDATARLPTHLRQVDERWLHRYRGWVYGAGFGGQLGCGVATIVTTSAVYAVVAAELLAPSLAAGAAIGAASGFARGAAVLPAARVTSSQRLVAFHRGFRALERPARVAALAAQTLLAAVAVTLAV